MYSLMNSDSISKMKNRQTLENKWPAVSRIPAVRQIQWKMPSETEKSTSSNSGAVSIAQDDERDQEKSDDISLPAHVAGSGSLGVAHETTTPEPTPLPRQPFVE